ncbi:MAG: DUF4317 family protein [Lachnospiraceae bacterium]|nr:DUF4317 family protein [Lachnospiraceae bacterium]
MTKSDIAELGKQIKNGTKTAENIIDWVYGCYVDNENHVLWEKVRRLHELDEDDRFRQVSIIADTLKTSLGKEVFAAELEAQAEDLLDLRKADPCKADGVAACEELRDTVIENVLHTDPYYLSIARIVYDVPTKAKDGSRLEDGEFVYDALVVSICPAKLSTAALGFDDGEIRELAQRWEIKKPVRGFLYPAFSDRTEDRNMVLLRSKIPEEETLFSAVFAIREVPASVETQKAKFGEFLVSLDVTMEEAAAISSNIIEQADEFTDGIIRKDQLQQIVEQAGASVENFDEAYASCTESGDVSAEVVSAANTVISTDTCSIHISTDKSEMIKKQTIDGVSYILVPVDGEVTVNGVQVR